LKSRQTPTGSVLKKGVRAFMGKWLLRILVALLVLALPSHFLFPSKKDDQQPSEETVHRAASSIRKNINVLSNLGETTITPILDFINTQTGLACGLRNIKYGEVTADLQYDLFIGFCFDIKGEKIFNYESSGWKERKISHVHEGVFTWSKWHSCLALNNLFLNEQSMDEIESFEMLTGKITALNPEKDPLIQAVFFTLYKKYGRDFLIEINDAVPLYRESKEELIFAVESGQYSGTFGIDGYFRKSIAGGYPISIYYRSFNKGKYPAITVSGENIAFIPEKSMNREGAAFVIDFMSSEIFQSFIEESAFTPVTVDNLQVGDHFSRLPEEVIPVECDPEGLEDFIDAWKQIAFPEATVDLISD
jgi:hypothetical protein